MKNLPLVSIIIPTFNRQHFVGDAIDSCLAQSYPNCEIIVIDDGSTDDTESFLRHQYGNQIRYIHQANQGPGIARNRGVAAARGDYIQFCDADDQLASQKVQTCIDYLQAHPEVAVVHTHYQFVASDGSTPLETTPFPQFTEDIFCELLRLTGCHILISSTMMRTAAFRDVGGFPDDAEFRSAEDWDLFLRLAAKYKFHGIDEPLVYRRMHGDMLSDDRLHGALGRLKTVQNARHYGWERCMSATDFDHKEAARHHVYGLYLWQQGHRAQARRSFQRAAELYPPEALPRRLYAVYTRFLPPASIDWTLGISRRMKKLVSAWRRTAKNNDAPICRK